jgi:hypothetical protein
MANVSMENTFCSVVPKKILGYYRSDTMADSTMLMSMSMSSVLVCMCFIAALGLFLMIRNNTSGSGTMPVIDIPPGSCLEAENNNRPIAGYEYTTRVQDAAKKWVCPQGYSDTGCSWDKGKDVGKLQCRRKVTEVKPGPWESPWYGSKPKEIDWNKDERGRGYFRGTCPDGKNITGIVLHGGEDDNAQTNAINAFCSRPDFGEVSSAFPLTPVGEVKGCGNTGFGHGGEFFKGLGAVFGDLFSGNFKFTSAVGVSAKTGQEYTQFVDNAINPGFSRKPWTPYVALTSTGFTGWEVIPGGKDAGCPKSGLCGLNLITAEGIETGWAGGEGTKLPSNHKNKKQTGRCPPGKIIKEIRTKCGDRPDGIQFICDVP